jgi:hypothetical protein
LKKTSHRDRKSGLSKQPHPSKAQFPSTGAILRRQAAIPNSKFSAAQSITFSFRSSTIEAHQSAETTQTRFEFFCAADWSVWMSDPIGGQTPQL